MSLHAWAWVAVVGGAFVCLFGYRLLRVTLGVVGFAAGAAAGAWLGFGVLHASRLVTLIVAVLGGAAGVVLSVLLFHVGIFIAGAAAGALTAFAFVSSAARVVPFWVFAGAALAGGLLALMLKRPVLSLLTAFGGAAVVVPAAFYLAGRYELGRLAFEGTRLSPAPGPLMVLAWVVFGIIGTVLQLRTTRKKKAG